VQVHKICLINVKPNVVSCKWLQLGWIGSRVSLLIRTVTVEMVQTFGTCDVDWIEGFKGG